MILRINILITIGQKDALTLAGGLRFDDINRFLIRSFICKAVPEFSVLSWKEKGPREKFILLWKLFLHFDKVSGQMVLSA